MRGKRSVSRTRSSLKSSPGLIANKIPLDQVTLPRHQRHHGVALKAGIIDATMP
jgi:hypothetical protein